MYFWDFISDHFFERLIVIAKFGLKLRLQPQKLNEFCDLALQTESCPILSP
jgi:hypothetical protein